MVTKILGSAFQNREQDQNKKDDNAVGINFLVYELLKYIINYCNKSGL